MGMHWFWWGSILIFCTCTISGRHRKKKNNLIKKKKVMEYYFSKTINDSFNAIEKLQQLLKWKDLSTNRNRFKSNIKKNWM
jgi:hypothetical protein